MSLTDNITPEFQVLPSGNDPREPTGIWRARDTQDGDASGGEHILRATLVSSSHQRGWAAYFTVLQVTVQKQNTDGDVVAFQMENFSRDQGTLEAYGTLRRTIDMDAGVFWSAGLLRDERPMELGFSANGVGSSIAASFPNDNGIADTFEAFGYFWLSEAAWLPGGPVENQFEAAQVQEPNYPVGKDSYYAKLRRGEKPQVEAAAKRQARRIVAVVPNIDRRRTQVSATASDRAFAETVVSDVRNTGVSLQTAISEALGKSAQQVASQIANVKPGETPPPGYRYANIGGRIEEGSGI